MTPEFFESLLYSSESDALDFKSSQYHFDDDEKKAEFLKDILAFANSWRRTDAYILIGVEEVQGGRCKVVGEATHPDDSSLQQYVQFKVNRPLHFSCSVLQYEEKQVGVIHIPLQGRPFFLKKNIQKLKAHAVYVRRGSSTAIAAVGKSNGRSPGFKIFVGW